MADPDRIIFIAAYTDRSQSPELIESSPPAYPTTGHYIFRNDATGQLFISTTLVVSPGNTLVGDRVWYSAPSDCFDDPPKRIYKPGQKRVKDFQYRDGWRGWPFIQYTLPKVDPDEFVKIMAQFELTKTIDGWVWFSQWNAENRTWKLKLGVMEMPTAIFTGGSLYSDVTLGFGGIRPTEYSI